jgi:L-amino acid N-acyltransferase YncA
MRFENMKKEQIEDIYSISESYDLSKGNENERGFLVSSFSKKDYLSFFEDEKKYMYVAIDQSKALGFIYGYFIENADTSKSSEIIKQMGNNTDFVVKQICVHKDSPKGTGTFLMEMLIKLVDGDIYLAIVSRPLNITSLLFHKKMGFVEVARIIEKDELGRIIMVRYKHQESSSFAEAGLVQYQTAVELYKHEDQLTWTKFNFSVITNGAILSILVPNLSSSINKPVFIFLVIAVILINIGYIYTIKMGRIYLQKRKKDAMNLEDRLHHIGLAYMIKNTINNKKLKTIMDNSSTRFVQYIIPMIFIIGWIVILILTIN